VPSGLSNMWCVWATFACALLGSAQIVVQGVVINSLTGDPVPRARVRIERDSEGNPHVAYATANATGKFEFRGLEAGDYGIQVERPGYATFCISGESDECGFTLREGERKSDLMVKLTPAGAIVGRVFDSTGEPMARASVTASGPDIRSADTDDEGRFRIGGLVPGNYFVRADPRESPSPPEIRTDGSVELHHNPTYYPSTIQRNVASRVEVAPGTESAGVEIRLAAGPIVSVSGRVLIPVGAKDMHVAAWRVGGGSSSSSSVPPDGRFTLWRLAPGRYTVNVQGRAVDGRPMTAALNLEVGEVSLTDLELRIIPPFEMKGRVEFSEVPPEPASANRPRIFLEAMQPQTFMVSAEVSGELDFRFGNLPAGRYRLRVSDGYVKSLRLGSAEHEGPIMDLTSGPPGEVVARVAWDVGSISGVVRREDRPLAGARVFCLEEGREAAPLTFTTDPHGAYSLNKLAPGRYRLLVIPANVPFDPRLDDWPEEFESVELHGGEKLLKDLMFKQVN
jgi:hypothetical protein